MLRAVGTSISPKPSRDPEEGEGDARGRLRLPVRVHWAVTSGRHWTHINLVIDMTNSIADMMHVTAVADLTYHAASLASRTASEAKNVMMDSVRLKTRTLV